jgi:hypothetical protein
MRLMAVMSYLHTMIKGKRLHGAHGMHGLRRLLFLENSVNTHQYLAKKYSGEVDISSATENRSYESPPSPHTTQAALIQHNKRAAYQADCIWGQETTTCICQMETKSLAYWG